uniref:Coenzyme A biosynthesis bifunctional protein CoaBC n=1 Tax=Candidatus Nitrotoga fabula TaxID=2182327 RepID=A0A2X0SJA2_9PROT|nr:fused 4'-phosphopantothenoylcysteine decarboxylase; phosphopantothenoylcysteine synthetase, FMN-binding [Candidatus Nitrotoga fabula]
MQRIMNQIQNKNIILGLTGSIAVYKSAELTRLLLDQGTQVQVVMTDAACRFITPATMQALSGKPVLIELWQDNHATNQMDHINLGRTTNAILIAPASADFIAKLAHGLADDLLSTVCLARDCPLIVAPAMNRKMWENPAMQRNLKQLETDGITILGPASGIQACGEEGMGRMLEPGELADAVSSFFWPKLLSGIKILITAGPTYEQIDAVRGITNRSSGKMGYAVAKAALELGAEVTMISGPTALLCPHGIALKNVTSAAEMFSAVQELVADADIFIGVAAVADYRVAQPVEHKIKKSVSTLTLELIPNPDILGYVAGLPSPPFCVGFAAESQNLREYAETKRKAKNIQLIAANLVQEAIGADDNEMVLFDAVGETILPRADKLTQARALLQRIIQLYRQGTQT